MDETIRKRSQVAATFLKIGVLGFGAPAIWGLIQAEVQERRGWLSKERYLEGLALVNALPGAPAMQMCIFAGHQRAGMWGGLLAGLAFMAPAFAMVLLLSALASAYGALPVLRDAFYGLSPVVLGIFIVAIYRLGTTAIKDVSSILIAATAAGAAAFSLLGLPGILLLAACAGVATHYSRKAGLIAAIIAVLLIGAERLVDKTFAVSMSATAAPDLWSLGTFFFKVGAVTFGGGMTIIYFVQDQVVNHLHWITAQEFLECLTLAQFTPGPIIMVGAYVGYKVAGFAGAAVAALAIFLPSFLLMLSILPVFERVRRLAWVKAAMRGISPAVVGAIVVSIVHLAPHAAPDLFAALLLAGSVVALLVWRKLPVVPLTLGGGLIGILARSRLAHRLRELAF
ncbi:MAG TPA: chromate efflux transporter [Burkholderiales bacterium]|nr:chromate efflux transporter [Burkholderiales bacterium]